MVETVTAPPCQAAHLESNVAHTCPQCGEPFVGDVAVCRNPTCPARLAVPADGTAQDRLIGEVLDGRYRIDRVLSRGGMGVVYVAEQLNVGRDVALKVIRPGFATETAVVRFKAEAQIVSELKHPNTLRLYDFGETESGLLYIVTELLLGRSLTAALADGPMRAERMLEVLRAILLSLDEAHQRGIVHRDLKPSNIFLEDVSGHEVVKVLDFGIAKLNHGLGPQATQTGEVVGTPAYMSPEQAKGQPLDQRSDLYSLGIVAYRCLSGRTPFDGSSVEQLWGHVHKPVQPLSMLAISVAIDPRVQDFVMALLAKRVEDRPSSARVVIEQIDAILSTTLETPQVRVGATATSAPPPVESSAASIPSPAAADSDEHPGLAAEPGAFAAEPGAFAAEPRAASGSTPSAASTARAPVDVTASVEAPSTTGAPPRTKRSAAPFVTIAAGIVVIGAGIVVMQGGLTPDARIVSVPLVVAAADAGPAPDVGEAIVVAPPARVEVAKRPPSKAESPRRPRAKIRSLVATSGGYTKADVEGSLEPVRLKLIECFDRTQPTGAAPLRLRLLIERTQPVLTVRPKGANADKYTACVASSVGAVEFLPPAGGVGLVTVEVGR